MRLHERCLELFTILRCLMVWHLNFCHDFWRRFLYCWRSPFKGYRWKIWKRNLWLKDLIKFLLKKSFKNLIIDMIKNLCSYFFLKIFSMFLQKIFWRLLWRFKEEKFLRRFSYKIQIISSFCSIFRFQEETLRKS